MTKKAQILEDLERVSAILPAPIYWEDVNSTILGANEHVFKASGAFTRDAYVGKSLYELYPKNIADHIKLHNEEVMRKGEVLSQEEAIEDISTGQIKYFMAVKGPLRDDDGNIIGIVGTSVDITAKKEAEHLRLENEIHKQSLKDQENFLKLANQVAHDIRSPLASLLMIVKSCTEIPEAERIALREAAISIGDIANNLLNQYKTRNTNPISDVEDRQSILISATLLQLMTEKKYEYQNTSIKLDHDISQSGHFAFIKIDVSAFKRMMSNLINNAVEACENEHGKILVTLDATDEWVSISIKDNGKGMSTSLINKIKNHIAVTEGKKSGNGIGLSQVQETLQCNHGTLAIDSHPGKGTTMTVTFPRIRPPHWIAEEIKLGFDDIVVILDDDSSIHGAWNAHFESILKQAPNIQLKHFLLAKEALLFFKGLTEEEKSKIFFLADYELLKQELNGLDVIEESKIQRAILVTSHYFNPMIMAQAAKNGTRILPKQLASEILIKLDAAFSISPPANMLKKVDLVLVDDDKAFLRNLVGFVLDDLEVDCYYDPKNFLNHVSVYPKDTKILLDNQFETGSMSGLHLAQKLHEQGYTRLFLLSGREFKKDEVPHYLTIIRKDDIESIRRIT